MKTANSEMPQPSDASSSESLPTSSSRALREYVAPEGARTEDYPVTRSGRASKPPSWFGDYIYIGYSSTNPDSVSSSPSWEKAREEMQRAMAKEQAQVWWQDYCCLTMSVISEPETTVKPWTANGSRNGEVQHKQSMMH